MLQGGSLIRNVTVCELFSMVAALFRAPAHLNDVIAGLSEIAGRRTHKLSARQAQRVKFAVALVSNPELLILDQLTEAMDIVERRDSKATLPDVPEKELAACHRADSTRAERRLGTSLEARKSLISQLSSGHPASVHRLPIALTAP